MKFKLLPVIISFVFTTHLQVLNALVDYTESDSFTPQNSGAQVMAPKNSRKSQTRVTKSRPSKKNSGNWNPRIETGVTYSNQSVSLNGLEGKANLLKFHTHFETDYNIFLAASYFQGSTSDSFLSNQSDLNDKGNPELKLGFHWLEIGSGADNVTIDLIAGFSLGQDNSLFATSRNDQIVGVTTTKRFADFALGLGYELRLTGDVEAIDEQSIGNISTLHATLGWMVSYDIKFLLEAKRYSVAAGEGQNALGEELSFSTVSPRLMLSLSPSVDFTLNADIRTRRLKSDQTLQTRLWGLNAAYGNSFGAGLSFKI